MYNKNNRNVVMNKHYLDQDSGIVTEIESDMEKTNYIFSDDDDQHQEVMNRLGDIHTIPTDHFNSMSYYTHKADQAVQSIRYHLRENWKKVLKHKSGTTVYMQSTQEKTALFRGEAIIHGFTPQSIFYVIGMRKLWDEQFEEGNLIENLNDTTSLTYESYKSTATSKGYDMTLVEKIECSAEGEILFACTSVDTPQVPKTPGKNRHHVKLQGWILKQQNTSPVSTQITYITQENIKGWIPGLTKKSLARKPLIITSIDNYLKKKADRLRLQQQQQQQKLPPPPPLHSTSTLSFNNNNNNSDIKSTYRQSPPSNNNNTTTSILHHPHHSDSSYSTLSTAQQQGSPTLGPTLPPTNKKLNTIILSNPPPRISSLSSTSTKHITFAPDTATVRSTSPMSSSSAYSSSARSSYEEKYNEHSTTPPPLIPSSSLPLSPIHESPLSNSKKRVAVAGTKLYPASRHRSARKQSLDQLKLYAESDVHDWKCISEGKTKMYTKSVEKQTLPILRSDSTFYGAWTPEQICSVIQCFGARKIWDDSFEEGHVVERFSQKEYLIYTQMKSMFPIQSRDFSVLTSIESHVSSGTIYVASISVEDELIPTSKHIRGSWIMYGWRLEPLRSTQHRLIGVKSTLIAHLDMGGNTPLPPSISRLLTTDIPSSVDRIQSYLRQHGCPPYIRRVAGKIIFEEFLHSSKHYTIEFIAKHTPSARQYRSRNIIEKSMWCTDLRTHLSMYPLGYAIVTQPEVGVRVEMRPDKMGFRIYTEKEEMDGQTIQVTIEPHFTRTTGTNKPLFTWNTIPLLKEQEQEEVCADKNVLLVSSGHHMKKNNNNSIKLQPGKPKDKIAKEEEEELVEIKRRHSHVIIFSEELSFTGHQFSFLILFMAISYYLGKISCQCSF